jgi:signal peptidase I
VKQTSLRSTILTAALVIMAIVAWVEFAPPQVGGSTSYVMTHGVSMEPRFHTGDLALVRPAAHYRVGMVVAYHSSLLKVVVLHRIVAVSNGHYTFKGDNNSFLDPTHPTRSQLVGALWLRVGHGGRILKALHARVTVILLCVFVGLLLIGGTEKRRRGRHRRRGSTGSSHPKPMSHLRHNASAAPSLRSLLIGVGAAGVACLALGGFALNHPTTKTVPHDVAYTQQATFGYHASAPRGAVYPDGTVNTGDPIFLTLVHRIGVNVVDRFQGPAATHVRGTAQLVLNVSGVTGWKRSIPLTPVRHFRGAHTALFTVLDVHAVQALLVEVAKQTGMAGISGYTLAVTLNAHVHATVEGQPVDQQYSPGLNFALTPLQLEAGTAGNVAAKKGTIIMTSVAPNPLHALGRDTSYATLTWLGLLGALLCGVMAIPLAILLRRNRAFDEAARIRARYGHLLVPILIGEDLGWPPVDVGSFRALVRLAEAAGQVILHHQADAVDTYLVNDNGTVYRYQISLPLVSWGNWTETNVAVDPATLAETASALADVAAPPVDGATANGAAADPTV